jgi:hypothetical protein
MLSNAQVVIWEPHPDQTSTVKNGFFPTVNYIKQKYTASLLAVTATVIIILQHIWAKRNVEVWGKKLHLLSKEPGKAHH